MRLVPKHWHNETWICSIKGHYLPAARALRLRAEDRAIGADEADGTRYSRCLRCDLWMRDLAPTVGEETYEVVPPIEELDLPRRGKPLQDAIFLRLIAIDRGVHAVMFGLLAIALLVIQIRLPAVRDWAQSIADSMQGAVDNTARAGSHAFLTSKLESVARLEESEITVLLVTATVYAVIEGIEAVFLWKERRWAEYLTVVATVGFIPFEVKELISRVTVLRVGALVVNIAVLAWLVWNKHLFGANGGAAALEENIDWSAILAEPLAPNRTPVEK